jgi:hypothetical protein
VCRAAVAPADTSRSALPHAINTGESLFMLVHQHAGENARLGRGDAEQHCEQMRQVRPAGKEAVTAMPPPCQALFDCSDLG